MHICKRYLIPMLIALILLCSCGEDISLRNPYETEIEDVADGGIENDIDGNESEQNEVMQDGTSQNEYMIIPFEEIDNVMYCAYYDYDLTDEEEDFLKDILSLCEKNVEMGDIRNTIMDENNRAEELWKHILNCEEVNEEEIGHAQEFSLRYDYYFKAAYNLKHIYWNEYKVCFGYEKGLCVLYFIPISDASVGYSYITFCDEHNDFMDYYVFDTKKGIISGKVEGRSYSKYETQNTVIWEIQEEYSGRVENGLRNGEWIKLEDSYYADGSGNGQCKATCVYDMGSAQYVIGTDPVGDESKLCGIKQSLDGKIVGCYSWAPKDYDEVVMMREGMPLGLFQWVDSDTQLFNIDADKLIMMDY